jgi:hypothetical protein
MLMMSNSGSKESSRISVTLKQQHLAAPGKENRGPTIFVSN